MEWDRIEGNWKQFKGQARQRWGKLTDDEWDHIEGSRERLSGKLQEKYGYSREMADKQIREFGRTLHWLSATRSREASGRACFISPGQA
jgi:uncharacterized protein YjbJ (UPF0337 family)